MAGLPQISKSPGQVGLVTPHQISTRPHQISVSPDQVLESPDQASSPARGVGPHYAAAFIPKADMVIPEAWQVHDDKLCVPRQLEALLDGWTLEALCDEFDRLLDRPWREEGIDCEEVLLFCKTHSLPYYCIAGGRLQEAWQPSEAKGRAIAFCYFSGHMYAYKTARVVSDWSPSTDKAVKLKGDVRSEMKPFETWEVWDGTPRPGTFHCEDLTDARKRLLASGRSPRVTLRGLPEIASLRYTCIQEVDGCSGDCVLRETPEHADLIRKWLKRLGDPVEFCGERVPGITQKVLLTKLAAERRRPRASEREELLARQHNRCSICSEILEADTTEWDHVAPLKSLTRGQAQTFQALCGACHREKTALQGETRTLESRFSPRVWETYVCSPKNPPLVWSPHAGETSNELAIEIDVRRCRRNALAYSTHKWSVFSALDSIVPAREGQLADFSFVEDVKDRRTSALSRLPFVGRGWYHRVAVEFLLEHSICTWSNLSWSLSSTARLPHDIFLGALEEMESAWPLEAQLLDLPKLSVNSCIGLWAIKAGESLRVVSSNAESDGRGRWLKRVFDYGTGTIVDSIYRTELLTNASYRPIHDQVLATEATRVAELYDLVRQAGVVPRAVSDVKTDCPPEAEKEARGARRREPSLPPRSRCEAAPGQLPRPMHGRRPAREPAGMEGPGRRRRSRARPQWRLALRTGSSRCG